MANDHRFGLPLEFSPSPRKSGRIFVFRIWRSERRARRETGDIYPAFFIPKPSLSMEYNTSHTLKEKDEDFQIIKSGSQAEPRSASVYADMVEPTGYIYKRQLILLAKTTFQNPMSSDPSIPLLSIRL